MKCTCRNNGKSFYCKYHNFRFRPKQSYEVKYEGAGKGYRIYNSDGYLLSAAYFPSIAASNEFMKLHPNSGI